ncbi:MAG: cyclohexanecarboxylate-CoA ligase, partial [Pseudonocardiales bacterium]|nr:cyclohexanecarboxylate-CoA ligase [Pseudonocardiales bacterium]
MNLIADFNDEYRAEMARTYWPGRTLLEYFDEAVAAHPDRQAVVGYVEAVGGRYPLTYAELAERVDRIAAGLLDLGVAPGQVVSAQLPNWWQLAAVHLACLRVGAVTNALMSIFRKRELTFMLGLAESVLLLTPETFNGFDHAALA